MSDPAARAVAQPRPPLPPGPYLVAGLGRAGLAAVAALRLLPGGAPVRAWDASRSSRIRRLRRELARDGVELLVGSGLEALERPPVPRTLVKSPGIPHDDPLIAAARARGIAVLDELEAGWRLGDAPLVAVTGTNGKSTVCGLATAILSAGGAAVEHAGNTDVGRPLSAVREPRERVVCEVSSFQLEGCPELLPEVAVLTNLSHDHLRRHGTMERYGACKRRLFVRGERAVPLAVVDVGGPFGRALAADVERRGGRVVRVGRAADEAGYRVLEARWDLRGAELRLATPHERRLALATRLPGAYNARNVVAALALADQLGVPRDAALAAIAGYPGAPGRFQHVEAGQPFPVVVDLALTPAAVAAFLSAVRAARDPRGRVIAVVGPLGQPDAAHLRAIGAAAARLADVVLATVGSFRPQAPADGLEELVAGARSVGVAPARAWPARSEAIAAALAEARPGDLVALLGRGRTVDAIGADGVPAQPVDDRTVVLELLGAAGPQTVTEAGGAAASAARRTRPPAPGV